MLETIRESLGGLLLEIRPARETSESRIQRAKEYFFKKSFSRKEYLQFQKTISTATASRDLSRAVKQGLLKKWGIRRWLNTLSVWNEFLKDRNDLFQRGEEPLVLHHRFGPYVGNLFP